MKFKIKTSEQREAELRRWHPWFAWHPVRLSEFPDQMVWLSVVERKCYAEHETGGMFPSVYWTKFYREIGSDFN